MNMDESYNKGFVAGQQAAEALATKKDVAELKELLHNLTSSAEKRSNRLTRVEGHLTYIWGLLLVQIAVSLKLVFFGG